MLNVIWHGLRDAFLMAWEVWWALVFGFLISAIVQAWVPRQRIQNALGASGIRSLATATGLGAASSSCSYAAVAIGKSLFQKGASAAAVLAFQFASTNLVWELGLVVWVLIGWQFTVAEYVGGIVMIALMALLLRRFASQRVEDEAREHAQHADAGGHHHHHHHHNHDHHHHAGTTLSWRDRLGSLSAWSEVASYFRADWHALYKEIGIGFLLAGFVGQLGNDTFSALFLRSAPHLVQTLWGALIGPVLAILSFVCSVGNVPLAAVLWSGGISFAGVLAFIFADLIVLPVLAIYRKYYGTGFALRITALMFVTIVLAALIVQGLFSLLGAIPSGARPTRAEIFGGLAVNYKLVLDLAALAAFATLFGLTARRGTSRREPALTSTR